MKAKYWTRTGEDIWILEERRVFRFTNPVSDETIDCSNTRDVMDANLVPGGRGAANIHRTSPAATQTSKRRVKIVFLPCSFVVRILQGLDCGEYFKVPVFDGLPEGFEVLNIMAFPERDAFGFAIRHHSFEETPQGSAFPELVLSEMIFRKVKVERVE